LQIHNKCQPKSIAIQSVFLIQTDDEHFLLKGIKLCNGQTKIMNLPLEIMNLNEKSKPHGRIMAA